MEIETDSLFDFVDSYWSLNAKPNLLAESASNIPINNDNKNRKHEGNNERLNYSKGEEKDLNLYYEMYRKSIISDQRIAEDGLNDAQSERKLDIEGLCNFVGNLSYSRETIQNSEIHKSFMDKFQDYLLPVQPPAKIDKPSARLLSSKFKRQLKRAAIQNVEKDQKLAKYNQLMAQSDVSSAAQANQSNTVSYKGITSYNHATVLETLQKHPHARTKPELRFLFHNIKHLTAFQKLSAFTLEQLCGVINYCKFDADRVVFLQGEVGTSWYVILRGSVSVKVSSTGNPTDAIVVKKIVAGEGFGDLALINDKPRAATIMTNETCEFARIEKDDYNRILRFMHDREIKDRVSFLKKMKQFESWNDDSLKTIAGLYEVKSYPAGTTIIKEKDNATHFFIVHAGVCQGFRSFTSETDSQTLKYTMVKMFEVFDYFGEKSLKNDANITYGVGVKALTDCEVVTFTRFDAGTRFKTRFEMSKYLLWSEDYLREIFKDQEEERKLHLEKAKLLDRIVRERRKDPTVRYVGNISAIERDRMKKKESWKI